MHAIALSLTLLAGLIPGWEIVLILAVVLILFGARQMPELTRALNSNNPDDLDKLLQRWRDDFLLWLAQGFGLGRIPVAPGTFGSLAGLFWFAVLVASNDLRVFIAGILLGLGFSIWICGAGEKILKQTDPGSIVLDEIAAMPICFIPWVVSEWHHHGHLPAPEFFFGPRTWFITVVLFALFRVFDVLKPWPVGQSQSLPGGWGVTVDDLLAAGYVGLLTLLVFH